MSKWQTENPEGRVFALIWTEGYEYQFAQFDPMSKEWAFYYRHDLRCIDPRRVPTWWHKLPRPPKGYERPLDDRVYALENENE